MPDTKLQSNEEAFASECGPAALAYAGVDPRYLGERGADAAQYAVEIPGLLGVLTRAPIMRLRSRLFILRYNPQTL